MATIPTRQKEQLPKGWSYPVGAEAISVALAGIPQYEVLELRFHRLPTLFASEFAAAVRDLRPIPVLRAGYQHLRPVVPYAIAPVAEAYYDEAWELDVYAVPAAHRTVASNALATSPHGLQGVRAWLAEARSQVWREGQKYLWVTFDPSGGAVDTTESQSWRWRVPPAT